MLGNPQSKWKMWVWLGSVFPFSLLKERKWLLWKLFLMLIGTCCHGSAGQRKTARANRVRCHLKWVTVREMPLALLIFQSAVVFMVLSAAKDLVILPFDHVGNTVCISWTTAGCDVSAVRRGSPGPGGRKRPPVEASWRQGFSLPPVDMSLAAGYISVPSKPFSIFRW